MLPLRAGQVAKMVKQHRIEWLLNHARRRGTYNNLDLNMGRFLSKQAEAETVLSGKVLLRNLAGGHSYTYRPVDAEELAATKKKLAGTDHKEHPLLRSSYASSAAWARALIKGFDGAIALDDFQGLAKEQAVQVNRSTFNTAAREYRAKVGLPTLMEVLNKICGDRSTGGSVYAANWMPDGWVKTDGVWGPGPVAEPSVAAPPPAKPMSLMEVMTQQPPTAPMFPALRPVPTVPYGPYITVHERIAREVRLKSEDIVGLLQHAGIDVPEGATVEQKDNQIVVQWVEER